MPCLLYFAGLEDFTCQLVVVAEKNPHSRKFCGVPAILAVHCQVRRANITSRGILMLPQLRVYASPRLPNVNTSTREGYAVHNANGTKTFVCLMEYESFTTGPFSALLCRYHQLYSWLQTPLQCHDVVMSFLPCKSMCSKSILWCFFNKLFSWKSALVSCLLVLGLCYFALFCLYQLWIVTNSPNFQSY